VCIAPSRAIDQPVSKDAQATGLHPEVPTPRARQAKRRFTSRCVTGQLRIAKRILRTVARVLPSGVRAAAVRLAPRWLIDRLDRSGSHALAIAQRYRSWIDAFDHLDEDDRHAITAQIAQWSDPPLISVLMPVYNPDPRHLREAIASVREQLYPHWELCIADDASTDLAVAAALEKACAAESRIKLVRRRENGHISVATNSALELATGGFIALVDHDDLLPPHALYEVAAVLVAHPDADIVFSDEDQIDDTGRRSMPYFKPGWNPELMLGHNLISHFAAYRSKLVRRAGGFRIGLEGSQDYDVALRVLAQSAPERIHHIPAVLYHWRRNSRSRSFSETQLERCIAAARRALRDYLNDIGIDAVVAAAPALPQSSRIIYTIPDPAPMVSVIIRTGDRASLLKRCIDGILHRTDYTALEVIVIDNDSKAPDALALLQHLSGEPRIRVLRRAGSCNEAALSNFGVAEAQGTLVLLLNDNIDVIGPGWLHEMVSHAIRPEIGAVGAKLLYPDGRVQHAGITVGGPGVAGHPFRFCDGDAPGYCGHLQLVRNVTVVTAACLMVRRATFLKVGGLNETELGAAFNDVDFCLRLAESGLLNVWTPHAELYHDEPTPRGPGRSAKMQARFEQEIAYMRRRWGSVLETDPFWNPNLSLDDQHCALAFPPRRTKPWRTKTSCASRLRNAPCSPRSGDRDRAVSPPPRPHS
jgi:O-antigen biosynthesis protein